MSVRVVPAVVATSCAVLVALLLFVPYVAREYRRRGEFDAGGFAWRFALLVYVLGLAAYVLVPLPPASFCARPPDMSPQLRPLASFGGVVEGIVHGAGIPGLLSDRALWQGGLNVVLFLPLGVFVRSSGRGVREIALVGAGTSLLIELTQLTGVWFLRPCPYRLFDVDDLLANTAGAVLGGVFARPSRRSEHSGVPADEPRPVTSHRRLLGMSCDVLLLWWIGGTLSRSVHLVIGGAAGAGGFDRALVGTWLEQSSLWFLPAVLLLLITVLGGGSSLGQHAVLLRVVSASGRPGFGAVCRRWMVGVGGLGLVEGLLAGLGFGKVWLPVVMLWCAVHAYGLTRGDEQRGLGDRFAGTTVTDTRHAGAPTAVALPVRRRRTLGQNRRRFPCGEAVSRDVNGEIACLVTQANRDDSSLK